MKRLVILIAAAAMAATAAAQDRPNILVVWGDDIGQSNISAYLLVPAQSYVGNFLKTLREFPPRQKAASFSLDQVMELLAPTSH
jgi:hypothetical protein